jgi:opacity protein-like surface antigen
MRLAGYAAAAVVALGLATAANAQGLGGPFYLKGFGGFTFPQSDATDIDTPAGSASGTIDYDTGWALGAAVGYSITPNIAAELEYAYRAADLKNDVSGDTNSNAVMVNAIYNFGSMGATGAWKPYVGGGLGWANIDVSTDDFGSFTRNDAFAYQFIGGVAYQISPQLSLLGELRWFGTDNRKADGPNDTSFDVEYNTVDVLVGASYNF